MTQDPSIPPDDHRLPPQHRVPLEELRKDGVESNLWDLEQTQPADGGEPVFDEPLEIEAMQPPPPEDASPTVDSVEDQPEPEQPATRFEAAELPRERTTQPRLDEIGDLGEIDGWDESDAPAPASASAGEAAPDAPEASPAAELAVPAKPSATPHTRTDSHRRRSFSRNEIIATSSVLLTLVLLCGFYLISALGGLPRSVDPYQKPELPAKGDHFAVNQIRTYWRVPVTTGPDADTVQRGTELMPIVELVASGEDAALRVQFRNSEGMAVGDPITRSVRGTTTLTIPSTAGLEDVNTHNAYRTGLIDPWSVEVLEASAGTTSGSSFRSLITVPISPDRE